MKNLLTAVLAAALAALAIPALAQPHHGGALVAMLSAIKPQLNLNTSQQLQWDAVMEQASAAHAAARANHAQLKSALVAELEKPEPDLAGLAALRDGAEQQIRALHQQSRDAWLALYATFSPEQKGVVRDAMKAGLERLSALRAMHYSGAPSN